MLRGNSDDLRSRGQQPSWDPNQKQALSASDVSETFPDDGLVSIVYKWLDK